jgi:hypothetical protein
MLTAKDIAQALAVLSRTENLTMDLARDPAYIGNLCAEAFIASLPLKRALEQLRVPTVKPEATVVHACIEE